MIEVKNISYRYTGSRHQVFKDFSLTFQPNRIYGLLGKNGTGKKVCRRSAKTASGNATTAIKQI